MWKRREGEGPFRKGASQGNVIGPSEEGRDALSWGGGVRGARENIPHHKVHSGFNRDINGRDINGKDINGTR